MPKAALFKWEIKIGENSVSHFGNMKIVHSCDGMGISGVTSAIFTFDVMLSDYPDYNTFFAGGSEVYLICSGSSNFYKKFYISEKKASDNIVSVTCCDRTIFTECDFPVTEDDFIDVNGNETAMSAGICLGKIASACGFTACEFPADVVSSVDDFSFPSSALLGKTCHDVLNLIAEAICGYWVSQMSSTSESLMLIALGASNNPYNYVSCSYHSTPLYTSSLTINSVYMTDGDIVYGGDTGGNDTIKIDTQCASSSLFSAVSSRLSGYIYTGWKCESTVIYSLPEFPVQMQFEDESFTRNSNYCEITFNSKRILASLGNNTVDEGTWKYQSKVKREVSQRIKDGDTNKNVEISKKGGIKYVFVDENTKTKEKYKVDVKKGGTTVYDGASYSATPASEITVSDNESVLSYKVGDNAVSIALTWDGDNIKAIKRTISNGAENVFSDE